MKNDEKKVLNLLPWALLLIVFGINFCISLLVQNNTVKTATFVIVCALLFAFFLYGFLKLKKNKDTKTIFILITYVLLSFSIYLCHFLPIDLPVLRLIRLLCIIALGVLSLVIYI